VLLLLLTVGH